MYKNFNITHKNNLKNHKHQFCSTKSRKIFIVHRIKNLSSLQTSFEKKEKKKNLKKQSQEFHDPKTNPPPQKSNRQSITTTDLPNNKEK